MLSVRSSHVALRSATTRRQILSKRKLLVTPCIFSQHCSSSAFFSSSTKYYDRPMSLQRVYRYLRLETFTREEMEQVFDRIAQPQSNEITTLDLQDFLLQRISELEQESDEVIHENTNTDELRKAYVEKEASRFLQVFRQSSLSKDDFCSTLERKASQVDIQRTWPITASMLLVGSSVGVITPAMPFVVSHLSLTASQYGMVVSAFALAKMAGNIPSAIAVERHGRKPYMTYSFGVIALGVAGIGLANNFEELYLCRLFTGLGVSFLSTAGTMMITDMSTPLNRASTMAPIMSAFAAGTALGPALGGILVDQVGLHPTFYVVGLSYLGVAALNRSILEETKTHPIHFPWQHPADETTVKASKDSLTSEVRGAVGQWVPLLKDSAVRNIMIMNGMYWIALAGAQMTLLPLVLTDTNGLAMTATQVGQVYMGMSLVQIFGNPIFAKMIDRVGKAPAIVAGCTLISTSMASLGYCQDYMQLAATLGLWSMGSSMLSTAPVAYISDKVDEAKRAQAIALLRTCGDVGFLIGATGTGALADWAGSLSTAMQSSAGLLLTATAWFATRQILNARIAAATKQQL